MKKVLAIIAIAGFVACNSASTETPKTDSTPAQDTTTKVAADTTVKADSTVAPVAADSTKK